MKNLVIYIIVSALLCWGVYSWAEPGDIAVDLATYENANLVRMEKITFNAKYSFCEIIYRRCIDDNGTITPIVGSQGRVKVRIADTFDNPLTFEDNETDLKYSKLLESMGGDGLKTVLSAAIKSQMGIE